MRLGIPGTREGREGAAETEKVGWRGRDGTGIEETEEAERGGGRAGRGAEKGRAFVFAAEGRVGGVGTAGIERSGGIGENAAEREVAGRREGVGWAGIGRGRERETEGAGGVGREREEAEAGEGALAVGAACCVCVRAAAADEEGVGVPERGSGSSMLSPPEAADDSAENKPDRAAWPERRGARWPEREATALCW